MRLEDYFDFSEAPDYIRIKGHRLGIEDVIRRYNEFDSPELIAQRFPGLSLERIYATITFYLRHQAEVDAYLAELDRWSAEQRLLAAAHPSPVSERLREILRQRQHDSSG